MGAELSLSEAIVSRPSIYTDEIAHAILEGLAEGKSLVQICKQEGFPGLRTVMRWAAENADFGTEYARAREAQAEWMDDRILEAAEKAPTDPQAARVQIDAYKWRAAKLAPKRYGDKLDITSGGEKLQREAGETEKFSRLAALMAEKRAQGVLPDFSGGED